MMVVLFVLCFICIMVAPLLIGAWLIYCTLILPGNEDHGRVRPSRAYTKRQIKKLKDQDDEM